MRRALAALTLVLVAVLVGGATSAEPADPIALVNEYRADRGLTALQQNPTLTTKAQRWSAKLAADGELSHSHLTDGAPANWAHLGENVGVGNDLISIQRKLEQSPAHQANLVGPYTHIGIGTAVVDGRLWLVQEFAAFAPPPRRAQMVPTTTTTVACRR